MCHNTLGKINTRLAGIDERISLPSPRRAFQLDSHQQPPACVCAYAIKARDCQAGEGNLLRVWLTWQQQKRDS